MANPWFRLWAEMVNDPKWRTIARVSGQEISRVIAVYLHMMTCASNAEERGRLQGWCDEDVGTALDIETAEVEAIRCAMEGRVLDGDYLTGWQKRQPLREREGDSSTNRVREFRARQAQTEPCNTTKRQETPREEEIREEDKKPKPKRDASAFARFWDAYPKKLGKGKAEKAFEKIDTAMLDTLLKAIAAQAKSEQWQKDGGQFIPYPATWLNEKRWEDELTPAASYKPIIPIVQFKEEPRGSQEAARAGVAAAKAAMKRQA